MRIDERSKTAYERHSQLQSFHDKKHREHFFVIENLESDYQSVISILSDYTDIGFDFCASCLYHAPPVLRVYNDVFTGRFPVDPKVSILELKAKLIADGYQFNTKGPKSGPLCLYDDLSEPASAKRFRLLLPLWEVYQSVRLHIVKRHKTPI